MEQSKLLKIEQEFEALISQQKKNLLRIGREIIPNLTEEDILQPFDYPALENNPHFRYEEGILAGMMSSLSAIYASLHS